MRGFGVAFYLASLDWVHPRRRIGIVLVVQSCSKPNIFRKPAASSVYATSEGV